MNNEEIKELREKILKGLQLSFERLVKKKQKDNGVFVFSKDDKIIIVNANDLKI